MNNLIESALAALLQGQLTHEVTCRPAFRVEVLPDTGTLIVVSATTENRAGGVYVAEVSLEVSTVVPDIEDADGEAGPIVHLEIVNAIRAVIAGMAILQCGSGISLHGKAFLLNEEGRIEGNRWVSELRYRFGLLEGAN